MDTILLSKLLKELILEHDKVAFASLGTFTADMMPASVSDKGTVINPPYRRLHFRHDEKNGDTLLLDAYARYEGIPAEEASEQLDAFVRWLRDELNREKSLTLPGLGKMRANASNEYFFIADRDLDVYPDGYGLGPVVLKVAEPVREEPDSVEDAPVPLPALEEIPSDEEEDVPAKKKRSRGWLWTLLVILLLATAFCAVVYIDRDADWVWRMLYSADELQLLGR